MSLLTCRVSIETQDGALGDPHSLITWSLVSWSPQSRSFCVTWQPYRAEEGQLTYVLATRSLLTEGIERQSEKVADKSLSVSGGELRSAVLEAARDKEVACRREGLSCAPISLQSSHIPNLLTQSE